ncbi:hypothetical protein GCM10027168_66400 [Streptomyces capparidis]
MPTSPPPAEAGQSLEVVGDLAGQSGGLPEELFRRRPLVVGGLALVVVVVHRSHSPPPAGT